MITNAGPGDTLVCRGHVVQGEFELVGGDIRIPLFLDGTRFTGQVKIFDVDFYEPVVLVGAEFQDSTWVTDVEFHHDFWLNNAILIKPIRWLNVGFQKSFEVTATKFRNRAQFFGVRFHDEVHMTGTEFWDWAEFQSEFYKDVRINARFTYTSFDRSIFHSRVYIGSQFQDYTSFQGTKFKDEVTLYRTNFQTILSLDASIFEKRVLFLDTSIGSVLSLAGLSYGEMAWEGWGPLQGKIRFIEEIDPFNQQEMARGARYLEPYEVDDISKIAAVYVPLQKSFEDRGLYDAANDCYYELKEAELAYWGLRKFQSADDLMEYGKYVILWATCGYGVRPSHTVYFGGIIILMCAVLYMKLGIIQKRHIDPPQTIESTKPWWQRYYPSGVKAESLPIDSRSWFARCVDAFYFSVITFAPVSFGDWSPTRDNIKFGKVELKIRFRTIVFFEGMVGWVLVTLFVITLGKTWIR